MSWILMYSHNCPMITLNPNPSGLRAGVLRRIHWLREAFLDTRGFDVQGLGFFGLSFGV